MFSEKITDLINTGDTANIQLAALFVESQGLNFEDYPLFAGARALAEQIGGNWLQYATPRVGLAKKNITGGLDFSAYGGALKSLNCSHNKITALNLSGCVSLEHLACYNNELTTLAIDINGRAALRWLSCANNEITELDVNGCIILDHLLCGDNKIQNINLHGCMALEYLSCYDNQICDLNLGDYTALRWVNCLGNNIKTMCIHEYCSATTDKECEVITQSSR